MIKNIDGYRNLIEKYNGFGYQSDDYLLYQQSEIFYRNPTESRIKDIIFYLNTKAISAGLKGLAQQLEEMYNLSAVHPTTVLSEHIALVSPVNLEHICIEETLPLAELSDIDEFVIARPNFNF